MTYHFERIRTHVIDAMGNPFQTIAEQASLQNTTEVYASHEYLKIISYTVKGLRRMGDYSESGHAVLHVLWAYEMMERTGFHIYDLDTELARLLAHTEVDSIKPDDVCLPNTAFYMAWRGRELGQYCYDDTGRHDIDGAYVFVSQGLDTDYYTRRDVYTELLTRRIALSKVLEMPHGRELHIILTAGQGSETYDKLDDSLLQGTLMLRGASLEDSIRGQLSTTKVRGRITEGEEESTLDTLAECVRLILNTCLYLMSPQKDIEHWINPRLKKSKDELFELEQTDRGDTKRAKKLRKSIKDFKDLKERWIVRLPSQTHRKKKGNSRKGPASTVSRHAVRPHYRTYWMKPDNVDDPDKYRRDDRGFCAVPHLIATYFRGSGVIPHRGEIIHVK